MVNMVRIKLSRTGEEYLLSVPAEWAETVEDEGLQLITDDIAVILPDRIASATGEVFVLKFVEALIEAGIIRAEDVQKALEHLV